MWELSTPSGHKSKNYLKKLMVLLGAIIATESCFANPVLSPTTTPEGATVSQTATTTTVNQTSQNAILNWQSFNINTNEATHFQQPTGGVALNRIDPSQGVSQIFGSLTATGRIILINQAGIYFSPTAHVNVGSLIASTVDMTDASFLAGKYIFDQHSNLYHGSIVNKGTIIAAQHGLVALIGNNVENDGTIQANLGNVILASGNKFTVDFSDDGLINFTIDEPSSVPGQVINVGAIYADGGKIQMAAAAAAGVLDNVINMTGVAQAQSVSEQSGVIILDGGSSGTVTVSGILDASGRDAGETGGIVNVLGQYVNLQAPTLIDVSGDAGGGTILVGGNFHGAGPEQNALQTYIASGVKLLADAVTTGNGGNVAVWSNDDTQFYGAVSAKGGLQTDSNGGYVETSGHTLDITGGSVNTSAVNGSYGTWLLDPADVTISGSATTGAALTDSTYYPNSGAASSTILNTDLESALASSNITVTTTNLETSGAGTGDITVSAPISWSTTNTLTLSAFHSINVNAAISNSAGGGLTLQADNTGTGSGTINGLTGAGSVTFTGNNATVKAYYNPILFPTQDSIFTNVSVSGTGSTFTPYMLINSQSNLQNINSNLAGNYALSTDLTLSGTFTEIGSSATPFTGKFDGQNHVLTNLSITGPASGTDIGFFSTITGATIENLGFVNSNVTVSQGGVIGTLVGLVNSGTISNIYVTGGTVSSTDGGGVAIAGLVGIDSGSISNSSFSGTVNNTGNAVTAGLVGQLQSGSSLSNSYSTGLVENTGATENYLAGIAGQLNGGTISNSYSTATLINTPNDNIAGGIVGIMGSGTITNTYWSGTYSDSGAGTTNFGAIVGRLISGTISNSYWDSTVQASVNGVGGGASQTGTTSQTTTQLQSSSGSAYTAFSGTPNTWGIISGFTYPYLQADTLGITGAITGNSGATVSIATNGANLSANSIYQSLTTTSTTDGTYYYLLNKFFVPSSTPLLLYSSSSAGSSTTLAILTNDSNAASINLAANTVDIHAPSEIVTNSLLGSEKGSLSSTDILFSVLGANLTVSGTSAFTTEATTSYNMDGTFTGTSGTLTFDGPVTITGGSVTSTGAQIYNNSVILAANTILTGSDIALSGSGSIDGGGTFSLTISDSDTTSSASNTVAGAISNITGFTKQGLGTLTLSSGSNGSLGSINISNNGGTLIATNINALDSGSSTPITVGSGSTLILNVNNQVFANTSTLTLNGGTLEGEQRTLFEGAIVLGASGNVIETSSNPSDFFELDGTITGNNDLTLQGAGGIILTQSPNIGSLVDNVSLVLTGSLASITTSGSQIYNNNVSLVNSVALIGSDIALGSAGVIDGTGTRSGHLSLTVNDTDTTSSASNIFAGQLKNILNFTKKGAGVITLSNSTNSITSSINVNGGTLAITDPSALSSTSTVPISVTPLTNGTVAVLDISSLSSINNTSTITLDSSQSTGSNSKLNAGTISLSNNIIVNGNSDIVAVGTGKTLTFSGGTIEGAASSTGALTLQGSGIINLSDAVGGGNSLASITSNAATTVGLNSSGVTTSGAQLYNGAVTLGATVTLTSTTGNVTFGSTLDGAHDLTIAAGSHTVTFDGIVGTTPLASLTVTGPTTINTTAITTTGAQLYNNAVTLGAATTALTTTANNITFNSTLSGANALTIAAGTGTVTFNNIVGSTPLTSLSVTGSTSINTSNITTSGSQTYNSHITLLSDSTLASSDITAASIDGGNNNLTVSNTGTNSSINGVISNLASFTKEGGGNLNLLGNNTYNTTTNVNAGTLEVSNANALGTSGVTVNSATLNINNVTVNNSLALSGTLEGTGPASAYTGDISLNGNSTITTAGNSTDVFTLQAIDDNGTSTLNLAGGQGSIVLADAVNVGSLISNVNTTVSNDVTTTGDQTFNNLLTINNSPTLDAGTGNISLAAVDYGTSASGLTLANSGAISLNGNMGGANPLSNFTIDNTGTNNNLSIIHSINVSGITNLSMSGTITESGSGIISGGSLITSSVGGTSLSNANTVTSFQASNISSGDINFANTSGASTLTVNSISNVGNVIISNTGSLTLANGGVTTNGGNVNLATLNYTGNDLLTVNGNITTNGGAVTLNAANPNGTNTPLVVNNPIDTTGGVGQGILTIGSGVLVNAAITLGAGNVTLQGNGLTPTPNTSDASGGNNTLTASQQDAAAIIVNQAVATVTSSATIAAMTAGQTNNASNQSYQQSQANQSVSTSSSSSTSSEATTPTPVLPSSIVTSNSIIQISQTQAELDTQMNTMTVNLGCH